MSAQAWPPPTERDVKSGAAVYVRGVDTLDDPYYGTSQLSNQQQFHWTDGFGSYRSTNDASYNPNQSESGNWTPMTPAR